MKLVIIFNIIIDFLSLHTEMNNTSYIHNWHATLFIVFIGLSRQEYWSGFPFPSPVDHILSDLSTMTCPSWVAPHCMAFIELDKLWSVWSDWLVVCDCSFNLSALWCPLSAPTILLGFLLPWTWNISSLLLQQSTATAPYLGCGVVPLSRHPWAWRWHSSCRPPPLTLDMG